MHQQIHAEPLVSVAAICRPFSTEPTLITMREGATLADILFEAVPDSALHPYAVVTLEGEEIAPGHYKLVKPKAGKSVAIRVVPKGGGGGKKNILATIAMIAVVIVAAVATFYVGGAGGLLVGAGWSGSAAAAGGALVGAAVARCGPLYVTAMLPEPGQ